MLKLEARPEPSKVMSIASPLLALAITVVLGTILFIALGKDPMRGETRPCAITTSRSALSTSLPSASLTTGSA